MLICTAKVAERAGRVLRRNAREELSRGSRAPCPAVAEQFSTVAAQPSATALSANFAKGKMRGGGA